MIGEFITRCLILVFGFAYPALQCFKTMEKSKVTNQELKFWCQYWIIVAILTVCEGVADVAFAWLPVYEELKLGFIIYLWHSRTKGSSQIYETILKPYINGHETDIEDKLQIFRARVWDVAVYYWQNCTELGQTAMFQVLDYLSGQSVMFSRSRIQEQEEAKKCAPALQHTGQITSVSSRKNEREVRRRSDKDKDSAETSYTVPRTDKREEMSRHRKTWFFRRW